MQIEVKAVGKLLKPIHLMFSATLDELEAMPLKRWRDATVFRSRETQATAYECRAATLTNAHVEKSLHVGHLI